ncbi:MAG: 5-oxoprolinase subunit PxpB [Oscillospiraceae bacterium]|jgi:KipI family sensor histidine kinase inhibitor|nr:5-oxoprolinase subunit PxpB [Oscillospiraceae bacterium]
MDEPRFLAVGDGALCVEFGDKIDPRINAEVGALFRALCGKPIRGVRECVPTFRSLTVLFDPAVLTARRLEQKIQKRLATAQNTRDAAKRVFVIPVCYAPVFGEDMPQVSAHTGLAPDEIIKRHCGTDYLIYMLGFLPGFAYLGGLDPALHTPRLQNPRTKIPAGAVGIGGEQTGIYPIASPGGWQLIGRTPVRPYDPARIPPILFAAGDYIRFRAIDEAEYTRLELLQSQGETIWEVRNGFLHDFAIGRLAQHGAG